MRYLASLRVSRPCVHIRPVGVLVLPLVHPRARTPVRYCCAVVTAHALRGVLDLGGAGRTLCRCAPVRSAPVALIELSYAPHVDAVTHIVTRYVDSLPTRDRASKKAQVNGHGMGRLRP